MSQFRNYRKLTAWLESPVTLFAITLSIALLSYGAELVDFSLTADEDTSGLLAATEMLTSVRRGRWGSYLMNILVQPSSIVPFFPTALAVLLLSAAAVLVARTEKFPPLAALALCATMASSPVSGTWLQFNNASPYYAAGIFLACVAYALCRTDTPSHSPVSSVKRIFVASLCLGISMSTYQAQIMVFLVLVLLAIFRMSVPSSSNFECPPPLKFTRSITAVLVGASLFYGLGDWLARLVLLREGARGLDSRLLGFVKWDDAHAVLTPVLRSMAEGFMVFAGSSAGMSAWGMSLSLAPLALLLVLSVRRARPLRALVSVCALLGLVLAPSAVLLVTGNPEMPIRSMLALPVAAAAVWGLAFLMSPPRMSGILSLLCVMAVINSAYVNARMSKTAQLSVEMDKMMAARIAERVIAVNPSPDSSEVRVAFVGRHVHRRSEDFHDFPRPVSKSWFQYPDFLVMHRSFFLVTGFPEIKPVPARALGTHLEEAYSMPSWPARGSVKSFGDIVAVRL